MRVRHHRRRSVVRVAAGAAAAVVTRGAWSVRLVISIIIIIIIAMITVGRTRSGAVCRRRRRRRPKQAAWISSPSIIIIITASGSVESPSQPASQPACCRSSSCLFLRRSRSHDHGQPAARSVEVRDGGACVWSVCWSVVSDVRGHHHPTLNPDGARLLLLLLLLILHFPRGHASSQHNTGGMVPIEAWSTVARVGSWGVVCCSCCLPVGERALRGPPESPPCFSFSLSLHPPSLAPVSARPPLLLLALLLLPLPGPPALPACLGSSASCLHACLPSSVVVLRGSGWSAAPGPQAPRGNVCCQSVGWSIGQQRGRGVSCGVCACACGGWWCVM